MQRVHSTRAQTTSTSFFSLPQNRTAFNILEEENTSSNYHTPRIFKKAKASVDLKSEVQEANSLQNNGN